MALAQGEIKPGFLADSKRNGTLILLAPQNGGAVGWGPVYFSLGCDFGDPLLRVAIKNSRAGWRVWNLQLAAADDRIPIAIQDGDNKISIGRIKAGPTDDGDCPIGWMIESTLRAA